jgi:hypothetical protein
VQAKGKCNIFNIIIAENVPNRCPFKYRKPPGRQTSMTKVKPLQSISSSKELAQTKGKEN